jgi:hypothetical protein
VRERLHNSREISLFSGWLFDFGVPGIDFDAGNDWDVPA